VSQRPSILCTAGVIVSCGSYGKAKYKSLRQRSGATAVCLSVYFVCLFIPFSTITEEWSWRSSWSTLVWLWFLVQKGHMTINGWALV